MAMTSTSPLGAAAAAALADVEDYPRVEEAGDTLRRVSGLAERGARLFRQGRFDEAISAYSKAQTLKPGDPIILSNRSAVFCLLSQLLRERSAVESECQPLNGLDPTTHAELALKDAEKALTVCTNSPKSYLLKANALILLEQYSEARDALLVGLQVDPFSHLLQTCLHDLDNNTNVSSRGKRPNLERTDDFECTVCLKLLYEPVTTPCGHSFCRSCLLQSMDHGNKCPMCRTILFMSSRTYSINVTLNNIIQKNFPEEYAERKMEHETMTYAGVDLMPLFVMDVVFPLQKMSLNIFEPRYRLMVRRIMEGNRRMGMVAIGHATGTVADCACEVEIVECESLPDGRFYLEVEGRRRFRILRSWEQDGYRIAQIEWFQDIQLPEGSREREDLIQLVNQAAEMAMSYTLESRISGWRSWPSEFSGAENMPAQNPEKFSFWLANMLSLRPSARLDLLRLQDTRERIYRALELLKDEGRGCTAQ